MTRARFLLALVSALAFGAPSTLQAQTPARVQAPTQAPDQSQAQNWRLVDADQIASNSNLVLTVPLDDASALSAVAADIERRFGVTVAAEWPLRSISVHCLVVDTSGHSDVEDLIKRMRADAQIRTVQRMQDFELLSDLYLDSLFPAQSSLAQLNALAAHRRSTGSGVRVGVVDSGIDSSHPDLEGQLVEVRDFVSVTRSGAIEAHGTAIAGIIAADAANALGMVGVAPEAELVGLRACWEPQGKSGRCSSFSLARALNFAILNRLGVINLSLSGPSDPLLEELVLAAIKDGLVIVAAWGESSAAAFPASIPGVIAAGGSPDAGIPAPAVDVISTAPRGRHRYVSGSSVAAAHVSGVAALLLALRADLKTDDIARALSAAVTLKGERPMLDACEALRSIDDQKKLCTM